MTELVWIHRANANELGISQTPEGTGRGAFFLVPVDARPIFFPERSFTDPETNISESISLNFIDEDIKHIVTYSKPPSKSEHRLSLSGFTNYIGTGKTISPGKIICFYRKNNEICFSCVDDDSIYGRLLVDFPVRGKQTNLVTNVAFDNNFTFNSKIQLPKPFIILAGISGTGKTRFVRQQAERIGLDNYCLVSVRPDWHEPSDLLGYISHLGSQPKYITTDVLCFIVQAWKHIVDSGFDLKAGKVTEEKLNKIRPYWLCLDEMNLAPVEQYFADYLSILETRQWNGEVYECDPLLKSNVLEYIQPTDLGLDEGDILWEHFKENGISIPFNLIVAGTVNMDETTHGFSRKVLDRALSVDFNEFYPNDFNAYFSSNAQNKTFTYPIYSDASLSLNFDSPFVKESCEFLSEVNSVLKNSPFELAYRALNELLLSVKCINPKNEIELQSVWDDFLMMKVLPRIEGDSEKLDFDGEKSLLTNLEAIMKEQLSAIWEGKKRIDLFRETNEGDVINIECRSKAKISWMQTKLEKFGFTHFWK